MLRSNIACGILFIVSAIVQCAHNLNYNDLETLGIHCTNLEERYMCYGYRSSLPYGERGCECDAACNSYRDCCINAPRRLFIPRSTISGRITCLHVGASDDGGVYAISTCHDNWFGSSQIRRKCEGPLDLSDPLNAAPVTSFAHGITYRNRYCAECNEADMGNLMTFQLKMSCADSDLLTDEQIFADLRYDRSKGVWGVNRWDSLRNATNFVICDLIFDVPSYFNNIRFCKSNIISSCPSHYHQHIVRKACGNYMAVVYDRSQAYRNPHCAICNGKTIRDLSCELKRLDSRKRTMSFALLLDVNMSDGDQVGMTRIATPQCPRNHNYDPFFKRCRRLVCVLPGYVMVGGRCVRRT